MVPIPAVPSLLAGLTLYLALIAAAALAGGSSVVLVSLGHRPLQVLLSLTGGVLLGVGLLHLLPHAALALGNDLERTAGWVLVGFFVMFLLERTFHGHTHQPSTTGGCDHDHAHHAGHDRPPTAGRFAWCGAFVGLSLHSLADGAGLAASMQVDADHGGGAFSGFATFLAIALHKPIDSALIATLLVAAGAPLAQRRLVNLAYALVVPAGAAGFLVLPRVLGVDHSLVIGVAMAIAAGTFICIAAADLLPEVQFHSHDRLLLTSALALGLALAWGISAVERASHAHRAHAASGMEHGHRHPH